MPLGSARAEAVFDLRACAAVPADHRAGLLGCFDLRPERACLGCARIAAPVTVGVVVQGFDQVRDLDVADFGGRDSIDAGGLAQIEPGAERYDVEAFRDGPLIARCGGVGMGLHGVGEFGREVGGGHARCFPAGAVVVRVRE